MLIEIEYDIVVRLIHEREKLGLHYLEYVPQLVDSKELIETLRMQYYVYDDGKIIRIDW